MKKLDARGFAHEFILVAFVAIFAIGGVAYLVASHADSCNAPVSGVTSAATSSVASAAASSATSDPVSSSCAVSAPTSGVASAPTSSTPTTPTTPPSTTPTQPTTPPNIGPTTPTTTYITTEAESMVYTPTSHIFNTKGPLVPLWWNAAAHTTLRLTAPVTNLAVIARGDQCEGAPLMSVRVDNQSVFATYVTSTTPKTYSAPTRISAGTHSIAISFTNDHVNSAKKCDRNLYLDKIVLTQSNTSPTSTSNAKSSI